MEKWTRFCYQPCIPMGEDGRKLTACEEHINLSRKAAAEGMVLLENRRETLPLETGCKVAIFGTGQIDYVRGGGGSGEVTTSYTRNVYEGLKLKEEEGRIAIYDKLSLYYKKEVEKQYKKGIPIGRTKEVPVPEAMVKGAREFADTAVIVLKRFSGEGYDRKGEAFDGDFYLTQEEEAMIRTVTENFDHIAAVLDVGGVVDTEWLKEEKIGAALMAWQAGIEGGLAIADVLLGDVNPSGKLADTFARSLADYPSSANFNESVDYVDYTEDIYVGYRYFETIPGAADKVNYPFGYGLSYTTFAITDVEAKEDKKKIVVRAKVTNTGDRPGREVVQVYYSAPQGKLGKPSRELGGFAKTKLLAPGKSENITVRFAIKDMASYDDLGKVCRSAYLLEQGAYHFYVGNSIRNTVKTEYAYVVEEEYTAVEQLKPQCTPSGIRKRLLADGTYEEIPYMEKKKYVNHFPKNKAKAPKEKKLLMDVAQEKCSLPAFIAQLSNDDLVGLCCGQPNTGVANTYGIGNLEEYGVPNVMTADGPAGLRIQPACSVPTTAWPVATLLACTWDPKLVEQVGKAGAAEVKENNIGIWLTPALNIHRNALCGRNFEYYSEDPLLSGKMAAAMVKGIQSRKVGAAVKHFACNNKETNRKESDSRLSERALREIYLKGFEIVVKEADPWLLMTSYNIVNGVRASENYELLTNILRGEWGFGGLAITDWWNRADHLHEVQAGNDVKMAHGYPDELRVSLAFENLEREELEACASRVLEMILKLD